jgi:hypothetical protein
MKTIKYFSVLSLVLFFLAATAGFSNKGEKPKAQSVKVLVIRYQVNVHFASDKVICNTYWVEIKDETGNLVAPAQIFVPGKIQYTFYSYKKESVYKERGTKRVAMLTMDPRVRNLECENNLFTRWDVKTGLFLLGQTYTFDLYPAWDLHTDKN